MSMSPLNRRSILGAAAGGLALAGALHTKAKAQGEASQVAGERPVDEPPVAPGWHRFAIGAVSVTQVLDGVRAGEGPHPTFGENREAGEVRALMAQNHLPDGRFVNFFTSTILEVGGEVILVDTGFGPAGLANGQGLLVQRMQDAGFSPQDVTIVLLTHYHGDHIGGLSSEGTPTFPNARVVAGRVEHEFWTSDAARSGPSAGNAETVAAKILPLQDDLRLIEDGEEVVPGLTARAAFGHTPGMLAFELISEGRRLFLTADALSQFVVSFQRPDWHVRFDMDKEAASATRRRLLAMLAEEDLPFTGYHLPFPALGYVAAEGDTYRFVPETYRLLL